MRVQTEPPLEEWASLAGGRSIVTGHQPWLWHPGILAKYLAADAAMPEGLPLCHIVVDQDVQDALRLALPVKDLPGVPAAAGMDSTAKRLRVHHTRLGPARIDIPTGCQPPVELSLDSDGLPEGVTTEIAVVQQAVAAAKAFSGSDEVARSPRDGDDEESGALRATRYATLAEQVTTVLHQLLQPLISRPLEAFYATRFDREPWFDSEVGRLLHDAQACVRHYNRAVAADPGAGIAPLSVEPYRVELPLWKLGWMRPRERVYADLADSTPLLTTADGEPFDPHDEGVTLAPRALLMTAWVRRDPTVGLFIHGTGGWRYDRITEAWWKAWRNERLAPIALATADLRLDLDAPVNDRAAVTQAVWQAHHRPHNLDRYLELDGPPANEKQHLLEHMDDDRDQARRRAAFQRVHVINRELATSPAGAAALQEAEADLHRARVGLNNAALAAKRDWCFAMHSPEKLKALRNELTQTVRREGPAVNR